MSVRIVTLVVGILLPLTTQPGEKARTAAARAEEGTVLFKVLGSQDSIPEMYRLDEHTFDYKLIWRKSFDSAGYELYELRFPSPVKTPHPENNTVHAEYYRPQGKGRCPCVILLDITAGDGRVPRSMAAFLAQNGVAALYVHMAYYGPRRPPGSPLRLLSPDIEQTTKAVRQTVLDLRRAAAWMAARPELDPDRLGIQGTSLGSFVAALTSAMEPRLGRCAVVLGGGGFVDAYWDDPRVALVRTCYVLLGGTKEKVARAIAPIDPLTYAENLKQRKLLILAAKKDEIVPPRMAEALWRASGQQRIIWFNAGHYTSVIYIIPAMKHLLEHFGEK